MTSLIDMKTRQIARNAKIVTALRHKRQWNSARAQATHSQPRQHTCPAVGSVINAQSAEEEKKEFSQHGYMVQGTKGRRANASISQPASAA